MVDVSTDDRAVSPVIGVILMVAITVILAAVIGTFVLDLGQNVGQTGPQASLAINDAGHNWNEGGATNASLVEIRHDGGGDIAGDQARIVVRNKSTNVIIAEYDAGSITSASSTASPVSFKYNGQANLTASDTFVAGDILTIEINQSTTGAADVPADGNEVTVNVIHKESDNSVGEATVEIR